MKRLLLLCSFVLAANFAFAQTKNVKSKSGALQTDSAQAYINNIALENANAAKLVEAERAKKKPLVGRVARYTEIAGAEESRKNFINSGQDDNEKIRRKVYTELLSKEYTDAFSSNSNFTDRAVIFPLKIRFVSVEELNQLFIDGRTLLYKKVGKLPKKENSLEIITEYVDNSSNEKFWKIVNNVLAAIVIDDKTAFILERISNDQKGDRPDTYRSVILYKDSGKLTEYQDKTENQIIYANPNNILWNKPHGDLYSEVIKRLRESGIRQY